jgi:signal transduction histidine kinase
LGALNRGHRFAPDLAFETIDPRRMIFRRPTLATLAALAGGLLIAVFAFVLVPFRATLRTEVRQTIINRDAAVLLPVALRQLAQNEDDPTRAAGDLFTAVLESAQQEGMLAVSVFDAEGRTLRALPETLLFAELPFDDYLQLLRAEPISRFHPKFQPARYFSGANAEPVPVLEVLLPLHGRDAEKILGFAQYYIDARPLARELAGVDQRVSRLTTATLGVGAALISSVVVAAYLGLRHAARKIDEHNERLVRANFELSLTAKTSVLGQITSHLIHGLQGPVAGLRAVVAGRTPADGTGTATSAAAAEDWATAADYTERMQGMIQETVALLGDTAAHTSYELSGHELAAIVRGRCAPIAENKGVALAVNGGFDAGLDSHRGGLLCLIVSNLVQNAVEATEGGNHVDVAFQMSGERATVLVSDEGHGIPETLRPHLFEPGYSGRVGGSGLGLAISQLLARQIGAELTLDATGSEGTIFRVTLPVG